MGVMITRRPKSTRGLPPMHPGELLREDVLPALKAAGHSKLEVAERLGISRAMLEKLVKEQAAVTPEMALRLGKLCGNGPELWLSLQGQWDLEAAARRLGPALKAIPTLSVDEAG